MNLVIGCDLGTTNSVVCLKDKNEFKFTKDPSGAALIPSVVCYTKEKYVGKDAVENEEEFPSLTIRSSKRKIGKSDFLIENIKAIDVATDILSYLKNITESEFGEIDGVVLTVPAYFNQNQRSETHQAAQNAGLKVLRIINEPTAAALAYGDNANKNELVLVYDLGGGTFDVTLLQLTDDNVYQVLSTSGDSQLGGDDFDNIIIKIFKSKLSNPSFVAFKDFDVRLKKFAEEIKIQLNYKQKIKKTLKYCGTLNNKILHFEFNITQEEYLEAINDLLLKTKSHVLMALNDANKKISQLDKIILVGGSTKSLFVRNFIKENFNTHIYHDIDPDLTVAAGAARLATSLKEKTLNSAILIDVTPLSLGIETKGGVMHPIIKRNTTIPVQVTQDFITSEDNQESVKIKVYQGERPRAVDNEPLGEFELKGFEKKPRGQVKITVTFAIDASGLIEVSAVDKLSGVKNEITINPINVDSAMKHLDDAEANFISDQKIKEELELQNCIEIAETLMFKAQLQGYDMNEIQENFKASKNNLENIKMFIQALSEKDNFTRIK